MRLLGTVAVLLAGSFIVTSCGSSRDKEIQRIMDSPIAYQSHLSPWADLSKYLTWHWVPMPDNMPFDPRAKDPRLRAEIEKRVEHHMQARGYAKSGTAPDMFVNYHVAERDIDQDTIKKMYDGRYLPAYRIDFEGPASARHEWKEGSVLVFLFAAEEQRMIWQSSATAEVTGGEAPEAQSLARLDEAMKFMFTSLPGKPSWQSNP